MMFSTSDRTAWDDTKLGCIFGFFGGFNNAASTLILLYEIAPMSGNWGGLAEAIGDMDIVEFFTYLSLIMCFIVGANVGATWVRGKKSIPLLVIIESALLISISFIASHNAVLAIAIGGFAMGIQNGMTTAISHKAVRTSHLTSTVTDIGISIAQNNMKSAAVKGSKALVYMWGAAVATVVVRLSHHNAGMIFALGGVWLIIVMVIRYVHANCKISLKMEEKIEEWAFGKAVN